MPASTPTRRGRELFEQLWRAVDTWLASPLGKVSEATKRYWLTALLLTFAVAAANICLIRRIDNTNLGTSNGLWKSVDVSAWSRETGLRFDSGGVLYAAAYGKLVHLVPDALVQYGTPAADPTFRKMAILNGIFGGIASGLIFLLALRFQNSPWAAAAVAFAHATAGFILMNSLNSEDIIPAYALFLGATLCFFEFLHHGGIWLFGSSALLLALATLIHWTVMVPALTSFGVIYGFLLLKSRKFFGMGLAWLFVFICCVQWLLLLAFPHRLLRVWNVIYPLKASEGGWVGFLKQKGWFVLLGTGNYFSGAMNLPDYTAAFHSAALLRSMIATWCAWLVAFGACAITLFRRRTSLAAKLFAISAIALFLAGEVGALYSQPQDPQMQIQPMLIIPEGLILLAALVIGKTRRIWQGVLACLLVPVAAVNGYWNLHLMTEGHDTDSRATAGMLEMERLFPKDKTIFVSQGFEEWVNWQYVLLWPGEFEKYVHHNVLLSQPFVRKQRASAEEAAASVEMQIDGAFASGTRVIAGSIWTMPMDERAAGFSTLTDAATARTYLTILDQQYRIGARWETLNGPFVELLPAQTGSAARP